MQRLMIRVVTVALVIFGGASAMADTQCPEALNFVKRNLIGDKEVNLCKEYQGKVVLIVNTASKCGFTPQYEGLEALYRKYKDHGLVVLGFPSNDFGSQEPGSAQEIQAFCKNTYGVEFPMFEKTTVTARNAEPIYQTLGRLSGEFPQWNFHKYLLGRDGKLVASYPSKVDPQSASVTQQIEKLL
ncbi:MAG: glutathione peroxidase [Gammaproteobacteria bacterium]|nr:glutathione peroxidase [Gammaproteobacteria bacterium]